MNSSRGQYICLLPFHKFEYNGQFYLLNIEKHLSGKIGRDTFLFLDDCSSQKLNEINPQIRDELEKVKLFCSSINEQSPNKENGEKYILSDPPVLSINLYITKHCNLRCRYCYVEKEEKADEGFMSRETAFSAVDWLLEKSGKRKDPSINFFGGEPLLNFSLIKDVVKYCREREKQTGKQIQFYIGTNGTLIDDRVITYFRENDFTPILSLDGPQEIHDRNRFFPSGMGSYDTIIPRIKKILHYFPDTLCKASMYGDTDPALIARELRETGFSNYFLAIAAVENPEVDDINNSFDKMKEFIRREGEYYIRGIKNRDKGGINYNPYMDFSKVLKRKRYHYCGAGKKRMAVSISGDVYPCHRFANLEEFKIGSIFESNLSRSEYLKSSLQSKPCSQCWARYYCGGGGCPHDNLVFTGTVSNPFPLTCRLKKFEAETAIYIFSNLSRKDIIWLGENIILPSTW